MISLFAIMAAMGGSALAPASGPTSSPAQICPGALSSTVLQNPPDLYSKDGVVDLTLTQQSITSSFSTTMCWTYRTKIGGKLVTLATPPTLNVKQGERLAITLVNNMSFFNAKSPTPPPIVIGRGGSTAPAGMRMSMPAPADGKPNPYALMCGQPQVDPTPTPDPVTGRIYGYHRSPWNEANLHFHGLNTSPNQPSDDVTDVRLCPRALGAAPNVYHYVVDIPKDEPPGMYWYHPHPHGEALYQMYLGMTGAIIVHSATPSIPDQLPNHIVLTRDEPFFGGILRAPPPAYKQAIRSHFPNLAQIRSELAAQGIPDYTRRPGGDPFQLPEKCPANGAIKFQTNALTVNGLALPQNPNATFGLPSSTIGLGETQYWRIANTNANTMLDIILLVNGKRTPLMVTSRDGVALVTKNGQPTWQPVAMNDVMMVPAARVEFYLKGVTPGATMVLRTLTVDTGCIGDTDLFRNLLSVVVGTKQVVQHVVVPPVYNAVPQRFSDLAVQKPTKARTFVFTEYGRSDEPEPDFYLTETSNPKAVEHPYAMGGPPSVYVKDGTVEEWTFLNYTDEIHDFHIHQIHFMPIYGVDVSRGFGQMLDSVYIPHGVFDAKGHMIPGKVVLRMDFRAKDIVGTFVYHCHIMEHEDNGMMAKIQVIP
ncbi:MAG: multicopper oxidase domain-containing protein [Candidatus Eremiobacteraeota bacterium]|nr:multicopper oxidase domain-containing protein [Candidatus Eremiobacteraeota bacterium]